MSATPREQVHHQHLGLGLTFALIAAASYGASNVVTRQIVDETTPLAGSLVALLSGTLGFLALSMRSLGAQAFDPRRGALMFAGAGIFSTTGVLCLFLALERAPVVLVSPVANTNPLFSLIFVALLLRGVERLTPRVFLGAGLVVAGVGVLTLG